MPLRNRLAAAQVLGPNRDEVRILGERNAEARAVGGVPGRFELFDDGGATAS